MKKMTAMTKRIVIAMIMAATSICVTSCGSTTGTDTKTEVKETTTTTAVTTTAEPETTTEATTTKEPETTTTTEATTTKEPETTTTEVTTTEPVETTEVEEKLYTVEECAIKLIEEETGKKVSNVEVSYNNIFFIISDDEEYFLGSFYSYDELMQKYNSGEKVSIDAFCIWKDEILYDPNHEYH